MKKQPQCIIYCFKIGTKTTEVLNYMSSYPHNPVIYWCDEHYPPQNNPIKIGEEDE